MTQNEAIKKVKELQEQYADTYDYIGVRFETKQYKIGESCINSKTNIDRDDQRDFPEFGSDEYKSLESLNGTCSYDADFWENYIDLDDDDEYHVHVIAGENYEEGEDRDEMIIVDAVVVGVLV